MRPPAVSGRNCFGGLLGLALLVAAGVTYAADHAQDEGQAVYKRANCVGCHKWHGAGGGGYGGAALSLRKTALNEQQIISTVSCGRPGTGMPYFLKDSYPADHSQPPQCYGLSWDKLKNLSLAQGGTFLRPEEIKAVAAYVVANIKGKGDPNLADCVAFFGQGSSACDTYQKGGHHKMPTPTTE